MKRYNWLKTGHIWDTFLIGITKDHSLHIGSTKYREFLCMDWFLQKFYWKFTNFVLNLWPNFRLVIEQISFLFVFQVSQSDNKSVTLRSVQRRLTGFYKCEVTADAPSFHTEIVKMVIVVTGTLLVWNWIELHTLFHLRQISNFSRDVRTISEEPEDPPFLITEKIKYSEGDRIKANCTSRKSFPAANLTWFVNDQKVKKKKIEIQFRYS